jgi:hypothetical protein
MVKGKQKQRIPFDHGDVGIDLLKKILFQAHITEQNWLDE